MSNDWYDSTLNSYITQAANRVALEITNPPHFVTNREMHQERIEEKIDQLISMMRMETYE